ncbi:MAG: GntR family transcriptional regulator [Lentisphaerae bacterium]|nr:GntR family transcriptional regulator [Lentisphaerota bacterium]
MARPNSSERIYQQIFSRIESGEYPYNSFLPSEQELARELNVSRNTIRKAILRLANENAVKKSQGRQSRVTYWSGGKNFQQQNLAWISYMKPQMLFSNQIYFEMFKIMVEMARVYGYGIHFFDIDRAGDWDPARLNEVSWHGIFAVGLSPQLIGRENVAKLRAIPNLISIDETDDCPGKNIVTIDNYRSARLMTEYLISCGARNLGFLNDSIQRGLPFRERERGFADAIAAADGCSGVSVILDLPPYSYFTVQIQKMIELLQQHPEVDCWFCANDNLATLALSALDAMNISTPGQVMIAGFDGVYTSQNIYPRLTTLVQPLREVVDAALKLAIDPRPAAPAVLKFTGRIFHGDTTRPPQGQGVLS